MVFPALALSLRLYAIYFFFFLIPHPVRSILFPYTTLFRSCFQSIGARGRCACPSTTIRASPAMTHTALRSEEHTSELQSHSDLVCRLLLEKRRGHQSINSLCRA